jgi:hypothetical protein
MNETNQSNTIKIFSRPPTKRMIEKLKECLEKESSNTQIPCLPEDMKSSLAGLYKRGLIGTKMEEVNHKKVLCLYVTENGRTFLSDYNQREKSK